MTPRQARAARAMLGLDLKTACALANVGKRTLTEFEAGARAINGVTEGKIKAFYISRGVSFSARDNDGEVVKLVVHSECADRASHNIKDKVEYVDLFDFRAVIQQLDLMNDIIVSLGIKLSISQSIMIELMNRLGLNQKEIATQLGCTPSFINAIVVGKKTLPISYAANVQNSFDKAELDVERALRQEKTLRRILTDMKSLVDNYSVAWHLVHKST